MEIRPVRPIVKTLISGLELCRAFGIDFVSVTEAVDTSLPAGEMLFQMIGAVAQFERSLIAERVALASGQGWLADDIKLRRLIDMSVGPQQRQQAEQYLQTWRAHPWIIQVISVDEGRFEIVQYHTLSMEATREKLLQFPRGSTFQWSGSAEGDDKTFEEISHFAAGHGLKVIAQH